MQPVNVNPLQYPSVLCDKCQCETFVPAVIFKRIPGVIAGNGIEESLCPVPVYVCSKCGELMPEYRVKKQTESSTATEQKPQILLS